jgi:hypothetical protein
MPRRFRPLVLALLASCAVVREVPLEPLDPAQVIQAQEPLPAISYECPAKPERGPTQPELGWPRSTTEALFRSAFAGARSGPAAGDLHVVLHFRSIARDATATKILLMLTLLTFAIVPCYEHAELKLQAFVDGPGRTQREYVYSEAVDIWIHLLLLPVPLWNHPREVSPAVFENMLLHFLVDLRRDLAG